jgi:hypothetical protein
MRSPFHFLDGDVFALYTGRRWERVVREAGGYPGVHYSVAGVDR